jgi:hypothetical protein
MCFAPLNVRDLAGMNYLMSENQLVNKGRHIDSWKLVAFAFERLPIESSLRDVLLSEQDQMQADEFIHKLSVWLKLCGRQV